jgi:putative phosphoesterase
LTTTNTACHKTLRNKIFGKNIVEAVNMSISLPRKGSYQLGVISDTHGYLPPRALEFFQGADAILHAGDIGSEEVLRTLSQVAPVLAVRGNMDGGPWADRLAEKESIRAGDALIHLIHDLLRLRRDPAGDGCLAVVNGHTHRPSVETRDGVLYVNPGSAGAPRHGEPPCVAVIRVTGAAAQAELIPLPD